MDLSGSMQGAGGVGGLLSVKEGASTYYPTYAAKLSEKLRRHGGVLDRRVTTCHKVENSRGEAVNQYLDSSGIDVAHYEYDAYGNIVYQSGTKANDFVHRFSTKYLDNETGLYYYGYRYYDPVTGRWPSRDPIGERGGINLYGFVYNSPTGWIDYLGRDPQAPEPEIPGIGGPDLGGKPEAMDPKLCEKRKARRKKLLDDLKKNNGGDFKCESPCEKVSIVIKLPDPCKRIRDGETGHAGVGVGDEFWDMGPTAGVGGAAKPWWDDNVGGNPNNLDEVIDSIGEAGKGVYDQVVVEWCVCEGKANQVKDYWEEAYAMIDDGELDFNFCNGLTCSSAASGSLTGFVGPGIDQYLPSFQTPTGLLNRVKDFKHRCGANKGKAANVKVISNGK